MIVGLMMMQINLQLFSFNTESYGLTMVVVDERFIHLNVGMKIGLFPVIVGTEVVIVSLQSRESSLGSSQHV